MNDDDTNNEKTNLSENEKSMQGMIAAGSWFPVPELVVLSAYHTHKLSGGRGGQQDLGGATRMSRPRETTAATTDTANRRDQERTGRNEKKRAAPRARAGR